MSISRRSLLRGLLALPFAPLAVKLVPESVSEWFLRWPKRHPLTFFDLVRRSPSSRVLPVVEALSQRNHLLQDMVWHEGNMETGHRVSYVQRMPTKELTWRRIT